MKRITSLCLVTLLFVLIGGPTGLAAAGTPGIIGNTNEATLTDGLWSSGDYVNACRFQAPSNMTVVTMHAKVTAITGKYKCAIYSGSSTLPSQLLRSTTEVTSPATGWQTFTLTAPQPLTNGSYYWLAVWSDADNAKVYYSDTAGTLRWALTNYATSWPNPIVTTGGSSSKYCIYAMEASVPLVPHLFFDDFAHEGTLDPWIAQMGNWAVTNGVLIGGSNDVPIYYGFAYVSNNWGDYSVEGELQIPAEGLGGGYGGRLNSTTGARYAAWIYPATSGVALFKFSSWETYGYDGVNEQPMAEATLPAFGTTNHTLKLTFEDNRIRVHFDGRVVLDVTDTEPEPYLAGGITAEMGLGGNPYLMTFDNVMVALFPAVQTITFGPLANKTYGNAPFALSATASSGLPVSFSILSGPATLSAGTNVTITGVGTVTVRASQAGDANYGPAPNVDQSFTVTPKPITVTANSGQSKVFGAADPTLTVSSDPAATFTGALSRVAGTNVGNYAITQGTLSAGVNYSITFVSANFAITPKLITVTANSGQSKVFGAADPTLTYVSSDSAATFTGALSRVAGTNVGTYAITQGTLSAGTNYNITFVSANFAITPKPITVTANSGQSKVFGAADPTLTYASSDPGATFTGALGRVAGTDVGNYATTQGTLSAGTNYSITFVSANFAITPKPITVTANGGQSKVFGAADPTLTYVSSDPNATFTGALGRVAGTDVGNYATTQGTLSAGANYSITFVSANFAITPKPITVTANSGQSKVFGAADPTFTYVSSDPGATFTGALGRVAGTDVGNYATTQGTLSAGTNYSITFVSANFAITPKPITVTANGGQSKVFGASEPTLTYVSSDLGATFTGAMSRTTGEDVGSYAINQGDLSGGVNYAITFVPANFAITPKPIAVAANSGQSKVFGAANPILTYGSSEPAATFTGALSRAAGEDVGNYAINQGTLSAGANYSIIFVSANFAITPKPITVTAGSGQSKVFGAVDPTLTYVSSDPGATFTGALSRLAGTNVGTYAITQGTLSAGTNYSITFVSANFAITAKPITVTANSGQSKIFGAAAPTFTYVSSDPAATFTGALSRVAGEDVGNYAITQGTLSAGTNYSITFVSADFAITPASSTTAVSSSLNPSAAGSNVTFTVTVSPVAPAITTPTGNVQFLTNDVAAGSPVSTGGTATFDTALLPPGTNTVTANYLGDGNYVGSANSLLQVVTAVVETPSVLGIVNNGDGSVTMTFGGTPGAQYLVLAGTDLALPGSWVNVSTNIASPAGQWTYTDNTMTSYPQRFFRAAKP